MPPDEKKSGQWSAGRTQEVELRPNSAALPAAAQAADRILLKWTREARRMAGEFSLTGDWRHFTALVRHVAAMSWRVHRSRIQRIRHLLEGKALP